MPEQNFRRWALPAATVVLAILGAGALAAAAFPMILDPEASSVPVHTAGPTPVRTADAATPAPAATSAESDEDSTVPVSERADLAWVARTASAASIPERALAAYAGAALAVADTSPDCGLGWNTLAAIGLIETEHGTMQDASIRPDGTTAPTIIGIPLNGDGVGEVRDTDHGVLDGDLTWDRAVGPMQFIPETWGEYAQDGNHDGASDINQIDDAALTTAVYLCTAGDLTQPANWIAAIDAYNPSVEYNNRVAAAADHYGTLR